MTIIKKQTYFKQTLSCLHCGKVFTTWNPNPKYCDRKCKVEASITFTEIDKAVQLYEDGWSQQEIAEYFDVTQKVISCAFKRIEYKCRKAVKRNQLRENNL